MMVLDTNTVIYFFNGMGRVGENLLKRSPSEIAIPTIVLFELEVGIAKSSNPSKRVQQLRELTSLVHITPFGPPEAQTAAKIRARLEKKVHPLGPMTYLSQGRLLPTKHPL